MFQRMSWVMGERVMGLTSADRSEGLLGSGAHGAELPEAGAQRWGNPASNWTWSYIVSLLPGTTCSLDPLFFPQFSAPLAVFGFWV